MAEKIFEIEHEDARLGELDSDGNTKYLPEIDLDGKPATRQRNAIQRIGAFHFVFLPKHGWDASTKIKVVKKGSLKKPATPTESVPDEAKPS